MASYRFSASMIGRSAGRSATAAAAYRSATRIECERYGETHDYTQKGRNVLHSEIMAPDDAPEWARDRAKLWNAAEAAEKRIDSQLAREIQLSLPHELTDAQRVELVRGFVREQFVSRGLVADVAIHRPHDKGDSRNHHAHIMLTTRPLEANGFGAKMVPIIDEATGEAKRTKKGKIVYREFSGDKEDVAKWREEWAHHQNREFERLGLAVRVDHRSFEAQGIDREPEQHEGVHATAMKRKEKETRIGAENAARQERNSARAWQHVAALKELARVAAERGRFEDWAAEKVGQLEAVQNLSRLDQIRALELKAEAFEERLQAFYAPHLKTVEAEAGKIQQRLNARGILPSLRRFWSGRADRDHLDNLRSTIDDTHQRMQEARDAFANRQNIEKARLATIQEHRRQDQHAGIEKARERKEEELSARQVEAQRVLSSTASREAAGRASEAQKSAAKPTPDNDRETRRRELMEAAQAIPEQEEHTPAQAIPQEVPPPQEPTTNRQDLIDSALSISDEPDHSQGFER